MARLAIQYNAAMDIARLIDDAYRGARRSLVMGTSPASLARARERSFIRRLLAGFESHCQADDLRIFSDYIRGNQAEFGSERLLGDIAICSIAEGMTSGRDAKPFQFVKGLVWLVELDFSREWRRELNAINRLNCGAAENRLFIGAMPASGSGESLQTLLAPCAGGVGQAYISLIPHPAEWDSCDEPPGVWRLRDGQWVNA